MKFFIRSIFLSLVIALSLSLAPLVYPVVAAPSLSFSPDKITVKTGDTFKIDVVVDSDGVEITGVDAHVVFDSAVMTPLSVTEGNYFPYYVHNTDTPSQVSIWGLVTNENVSKTGKGVLASITFQAQAPGTNELQFFCNLNQTSTSTIVDNTINANNIINCNNIGTSLVTVQAQGDDNVPPGAGGAGGGVAPGNDGSGAPGGTENVNGAGTTGGSGSGGTGGTSGNGGANGGIGPDGQPLPTQLPKSGITENMTAIAMLGTVLLVLGGIIGLVM